MSVANRMIYLLARWLDEPMGRREDAVVDRASLPDEVEPLAFRL
jgi:hypothetical protein